MGRDRRYFAFVEEMLSSGKVGVALTYTPASATSYWFSRFPGLKMVHMPYVYRKEYELPIIHEERERKVLISGNRSKNYILRRKISNQISNFPPLRLMSERLPHSGYDASAASTSVIGNAYIKYLSNFRFAVVCSSSFRLEFLKYREFAYAGVLPVGDLALSMDDFPDDCHYRWRRNLFIVWKDLSLMEDSGNRASKYRSAMMKLRDRGKMQLELRTQIGSICDFDFGGLV